MFVREKILECTIKVKELFDKQEDALKNENEGKIISVDLLNKKFIRNNFRCPIHISSAYRSIELNRFVVVQIKRKIGFHYA